MLDFFISQYFSLMITRFKLFIILWTLPFFSPAQETISRAVYFQSDSYQLDQHSREIIDSISGQMKNHADYTVQLYGHTDNVGSNEYNDQLSKNRVVAVQNQFISKNVPLDKMEIRQFGELQPVTSNGSELLRARNRRVEIRVTIPVVSIAAKEEIVIDNKGDWPPMDAIVVEYAKHTYQLPGEKTGNTVDIEVINNTAQMEHSNFTTITNEQELLTSNLMLCFNISGKTTNCIPEKPVKVYIPTNRRAYCKPSEAFLYDAVVDTVTGRTVWKRIPSDFTIEEHNEIEYFVIYLTNLCGPCKNFDCKIPHSTPIKVKLKSRRFEITKVSAIYTETNALLPGYVESRNKYTIFSYDRQVQEVPLILVRGKTKSDKYFGLNVKLTALKKDKEGIYILTKRIIRKSKPRKITAEERKKQLENPVGVSPTKE
jgi:hypothetical protein